MSKNDEQIKKLLGSIKEKRNKLGTKPKLSLKTNGLLKTDDGYGININTVNTVEACIVAVATIVVDRDAKSEAAKLLDVDYEAPKYNGFPLEDWIEDFKVRASVLKWKAEDMKIKTLEKKLKDLRSEDLRTADALDDIASELS
jgi:hypothetical protein